MMMIDPYLPSIVTRYVIQLLHHQLGSILLHMEYCIPVVIDTRVDWQHYSLVYLHPIEVYTTYFPD